MPTVSACPDPRKLAKCLLGELAGPEVETLKQHLKNCARCLAALQTLKEDGRLEVSSGAGPRPVGQALQTGQGNGKTRVLKQSKHETPVHLPAPSNLRTGPSPEPARPSEEAPVARPHSFLAPPEEPDEIGRLGPYRVLKVLGTGGMGTVFQAEDPQLKRPVALKVMKPEFRTDDESRQRFLREARAMAAIEHDHIVTVYQVGEDCGLPFLAMQLLRGETLENRLEREQKLPIAEVLRIGREIAEGLAAAHERGLIHRDIKPANIWLEEGRRRVKILDFGLARGMDDLNLTRMGTVMGTPEFMSPEQAGAKEVDARSDLFSLGCVLYDMCAGQSPFQAKKTMMVLVALVTKTPRPVAELNSQVPGPLADLIMQLLEKAPEDRPASMNQVAEELRRIEEGRPTGLTKKGKESRWPWSRLLVAAVVLALISLAGIFIAPHVVRIVQSKSTPPQARPAQAR
jgi:serine/threonine protein kinase